MNKPFPKKPNAIEEIITSLINKLINTTINLVKNIRGLLLLVLASIGAGTKFATYGLSKNSTAILSILSVIALSF